MLLSFQNYRQNFFLKESSISTKNARSRSICNESRILLKIKLSVNFKVITRTKILENNDELQ